MFKQKALGFEPILAFGRQVQARTVEAAVEAAVDTVVEAAVEAVQEGRRSGCSYWELEVAGMATPKSRHMRQVAASQAR